ncbi:hypothetical protein SVAN01_08581 [Stagonosporopsis vannaccii]|nr:hypothetical protein SVAN01_08581 [Stagonosporopsis vannaccii]
MLFTRIVTFLFPVAILAVPTGEPATKGNLCQPVSYILTEYTLAKSPSYYFVSFNVQSSYTTDTRADDQVEVGANCEADGTEIHSSGNECNIAGERTKSLVFDLRARSGDANYRLHHKWQCNGAIWASENDIKLPSLDCQADGDGTNNKTLKCTSKPIIFTPQNIRMVDEKESDKTKAANSHVEPTTKSTDCPKCKATGSL